MKKSYNFPYIYSLFLLNFVCLLQNFHTIDTWHCAGNKKFKYKNVFINQISSWGPAPSEHFIHIKIICLLESARTQQLFPGIEKN